MGSLRLLPRLAPLEGDVDLDEDLPQALPAGHDATGRVLPQLLCQLAPALAGEGAPLFLRAGLGRLVNIGLVVSRYPAVTATRQLGAQAGRNHLVEPSRCTYGPPLTPGPLRPGRALRSPAPNCPRPRRAAPAPGGIAPRLPFPRPLPGARGVGPRGPPRPVRALACGGRRPKLRFNATGKCCPE